MVLRAVLLLALAGSPAGAVAGAASAAARAGPRYAPFLLQAAATPGLLAAIGPHPAAEALRAVAPSAKILPVQLDYWSEALAALERRGSFPAPAEGEAAAPEMAVWIRRAYEDAQAVARRDADRLLGDAERAMERSLALARENPLARQDPEAFWAYGELVERLAVRAEGLLDGSRAQRLKRLRAEFRARGERAERALKRRLDLPERIPSLARARRIAEDLGLEGRGLAALEESDIPAEAVPDRFAAGFWIFYGEESLPSALRRWDAESPAPLLPAESAPAAHAPGGPIGIPETFPDIVAGPPARIGLVARLGAGIGRAVEFVRSVRREAGGLAPWKVASWLRTAISRRRLEAALSGVERAVWEIVGTKRWDPRQEARYRRLRAAVRALRKEAERLARDPRREDGILSPLRPRLLRVARQIQPYFRSESYDPDRLRLLGVWARYLERINGYPLAWRTMGAEDPLWALRAAFAFTYDAESPGAYVWTELGRAASSLTTEALLDAVFPAPNAAGLRYLEAMESRHRLHRDIPALEVLARLGRMAEDARTLESALQTAERSSDPGEALRALVRLNEAIARLEESELGRRVAAEVWSEPEALLLLLRLAGSESPGVRDQAHRAIRALGPRAAPALAQAARESRLGRTSIAERWRRSLAEAARTAFGQSALAHALLGPVLEPGEVPLRLAYDMAADGVAALGEQAQRWIYSDFAHAVGREWERLAAEGPGRSRDDGLQAAEGLLARLRETGVLRRAAQEAVMRFMPGPGAIEDAERFLPEAGEDFVLPAASWESLAGAAAAGRRGFPRAVEMLAVLTPRLPDLDAEALARAMQAVLDGASGPGRTEGWPRVAGILMETQDLGQSLAEGFSALAAAAAGGTTEAGLKDLVDDVNASLRWRRSSVLRGGRAIGGLVRIEIEAGRLRARRLD